LGEGIVIINPGDKYIPSPHMAVAQEYIESCLLDGYKFDLRIYVLVVIGRKPEIYVYHDGIARFCSEPSTAGSQFSQLTNTAVNSKNPASDPEKITRTVAAVFAELRDKKGANVDALWTRIEDAVALTVIANSGYIVRGTNERLPNVGLPRCFQLLGFDILLDEALKPWVLEVNYRPSLAFGTRAEERLKVEMLTELLAVAAPLRLAEDAVRAMGPPVTLKRWGAALAEAPAIADEGRAARARLRKFFKVFPDPAPARAAWDAIYEDAMELKSNTSVRELFPPNATLAGPRGAASPTKSAEATLPKLTASPKMTTSQRGHAAATNSFTASQRFKQNICTNSAVIYKPFRK
jgi:hypothetical protein